MDITMKLSNVFCMSCIVLAGFGSAYADTVSDPCAGASALLSIIDRPTKADSACAVPFRKATVELGYQYLDQYGGVRGQTYPLAELRFGLPGNNEFDAVLPSYNLQTVEPRSGFGPVTFGFKHEIGYTEHWLGAVEGFLTLPTGGGAFGSNKFDTAFNGIVEYSITSSLSMTAVLGVTQQSTPPLAGGEHYVSFNPDLLVSWQPMDKLEIEAEVFAQSRTNPGQGWGSNADLAALYLLTRNMEIDAEFGQRISGSLGGYNRYYGVGMGFLIE